MAPPAFQGLDENENGCVRISIMAGSNMRPKGPYTDEPDQYPQINHFQLATHGRSIQMCHADIDRDQLTA